MPEMRIALYMLNKYLDDTHVEKYA